MTVAELIDSLKKHPQDLQVIIDMCSEYILISEPYIMQACEPRNDGWVACERPDKKQIDYLFIG